MLRSVHLFLFLLPPLFASLCFSFSRQTFEAAGERVKEKGCLGRWARKSIERFATSQAAKCLPLSPARRWIGCPLLFPTLFLPYSYLNISSVLGLPYYHTETARAEIICGPLLLFGNKHRLVMTLYGTHSSSLRTCEISMENFFLQASQF